MRWWLSSKLCLSVDGSQRTCWNVCECLQTGGPAPSAIPLQEELGKRFQCFRFATKTFSEANALSVNCSAIFRDFSSPTMLDKSPSVRRIFAGGFAELLARLGDVQDVVDNLEREADVIAKIGQCLKLGRGAIRAHAAQPYGTAEQGGGFAFVDVLQFGCGNFFAFAFEVGDLSGDEL